MNRSFLLSLFLFTSVFNSAQFNQQRAKIENIISKADGKVGVAVIDLQTHDTLTVNGHEHFPMQSVYKFPLAIAVLHRIDEGKLKLNQKIKIKKSDLLPNTWSLLRVKYPTGNVKLPIDEIIKFTVSQSDNNGCDILFRLLGGTTVVDKFIKKVGISGMSVVYTEEEMHKAWTAQYSNYSTPLAMGELLYKFAKGNILSKSNRDYLMEVMISTTTGTGRIKGLLPDGTIAAHKTGSSGTNEVGLTSATNDAGIVTLPDGKQFAIVVFVSDSKDEDNVRDGIIANITKIIWDGYTAH